MKCLFVFPNAPLAPDFSGGASRFRNSFLALNSLVDEVHVLRLLDEGSCEKIFQYEQRGATEHAELRKKAATWSDVFYRRKAGFRNRRDLMWRASFRPLQICSPELVPLLEPLSEAVERLRPDFVWAHKTLSGALATASEINLPWIYVHHDWEHRVATIRRMASGRPSYPSDYLLEWSLRRAEIQIVQHSTAIVTASQTEAKEISAAGGKHVEVIPTTYNSAQAPASDQRAQQPVRILHLGSLSTTANYLGVKAYLKRVHPKLGCNSPASLSFSIVGDASRAKPELVEQLKQAGANLTGHLPDLGGFLRPFDLAIIPYEHNTGARTKLSLLFNHAQVVVATAAAVAGSLEAQPGENCIVLPSLDDFPQAIMELASHPERRERLGRAAKATFEEQFTMEAQLPAFKNVLSHLSGT